MRGVEDLKCDLQKSISIFFIYHICLPVVHHVMYTTTPAHARTHMNANSKSTSLKMCYVCIYTFPFHQGLAVETKRVKGDRDGLLEQMLCRASSGRQTCSTDHHHHRWCFRPG